MITDMGTVSPTDIFLVPSALLCVAGKRWNRCGKFLRLQHVLSLKPFKTIISRDLQLCVESGYRVEL